MEQHSVVPPSPGADRQRRLRRRLIVGVVVLAVALVSTAAVVFTPTVRCGDANPISGLRFVGGECVGVTDGGGEPFHPDFREIQEDIKAENDWVADQHEADDVPAVKIALLSTLTANNASPLNPNEVRHALEGAYVAQKRANRTSELGGTQPLIQLYLANEGSVQQGWETAVDRLIDMTEDDIPLSIVMGQSISTSRTTEAAERLSDAGIPMVTGTTTADRLDHDHIDGLIRAAPSNTDFATAIRRYLDNQKELQKGILVFDTRATDTFASTLQEAYEAQLDDYIHFSDQPYPGRSVEQGGPDVFYPITQNICASKADMVFFTGRAPDLEVFAESLRERVCVDDHLTIVFVDLGLYPRGYQEFEKLLEAGNMTVLHATGYDPGWPRGTVEPPEGYANFESHFEDLVGGVPDELDDGYAITHHDSMATAISAVRLTDRWANQEPESEDVREQLLLLNGQNAVRGATGTLNFNENRGGNPGGKHVPIVPFPYPDEFVPPKPYITPIQ